MELYGRHKIYVSEEITEDNVMRIANMVLGLHFANVSEEDYLFWYRRGMQPIKNRTKQVRNDICNRVVVNNADQVVVFKNGYFLPKPACYVTRRAGAKSKVNKLNEYLYTSGKQEADNELANWFHTVGVGTLFVRANPNKEEKDKPVEVFALDPRSAFNTYSYDVGNPRNAGFNVVQNESKIILDIYTKDKIFRLTGENPVKISMEKPQPIISALESVSVNEIGEIPIIEYQFNENRMGAFEGVLDVMDAINTIESNRCDGIEQFIQSLSVAINCNFPEGTTTKDIMKKGFLVLRSTSEQKADFRTDSNQLDQSQTQVALDNYYEQLCDKTGMPYVSRSGGGTSDNVGAVYLRNGWAMADTQCRNTEDLFKQTNREFDKIFLKILKATVEFDISLYDFELTIPREEMSNLLVKSQGALNLKQLGLSPEKCLLMSGLSNDPVKDVAESKKYIDKMWGIVESTTPENANGNIVRSYTRRDRGSAVNPAMSNEAVSETDKNDLEETNSL